MTAFSLHLGWFWCDFLKLVGFSTVAATITSCETPITESVPYLIKPEEITFLSSNTWDVSGGGVFGYKAIWVNRFNKIFDKLDYNPKYIINNLNQLSKLV